jgi:hypothetical protein
MKQFLRTMSLQRIADVLKLKLNGTLFKSQSNLDIVGGRNITLAQTEANNLSTVTVTAGKAGVWGYFGEFWSTGSQVAANTTTSYTCTFTDAYAFNDGVRLANGTQITFDHVGKYNVQVSCQLVNTDSQIHDMTVWFRKNDSGSTGDVADSASFVSVPNSHGGIDGRSVLAYNIIEDVVVGDYLEVCYSVTNTAVSMQTIAAGTTPTTPRSPSIILTATQV